jgi:hypothetical protein
VEPTIQTTQFSVRDKPVFLTFLHQRTMLLLKLNAPHTPPPLNSYATTLQNSFQSSHHNFKIIVLA